MHRTLFTISVLVLASQALAAPELSFGSYGRVGIASNESGGRAESPQLNQFGPRLAARDYLELDFGTKPSKSPYGKTSILTTLAFDEGLFHYDGQWASNMALRRFQFTVTELLETNLFLVVGSQWNRGDDVYLLNFWPLDNVNSTGVTLGYKNKTFEAKGHLGLSRLDHNQQSQRIEVASPWFGAQDAQTLDRQRLISTLSATQLFYSGKIGQKLKMYGEFHRLPSGEEVLNNNPDQTFDLADDLGYLFGVQYGLWGFGDDSHLNVFARFAKGLAVYDELAPAQSVNTDRRTVDAYETRLALSANLQSELLSLMIGGYGRIFNDGDVNKEDFDDRQEMTMVVRPMLRLGSFTPAIEASWQVSRTNGLNPRTGRQDLASIFQIAAVPALTFSEKPGAYSRPRINGVIAYSMLNTAALSYYPEDDPRSQQDTVWFFGFTAEWWFGRGGGY